MGRGYIVEDVVERYLSTLCSESSPVTGVLIGQSSVQKDFIVMAIRTPQREKSTPTAGSSLDKLDMEWVTEHARQVSRMLPGGLSVLGVFFVSDVEAKDTLNTLRQLVFAVDKSISRDLLWISAEDDITDHVTLHVNSRTRKTFCRTFDVNDPKSTAKPADWKYQSGVSCSWRMVWCSLEVNINLALPQNGFRLADMEKCLEDGLKVWAQQIESGTFLLDGRRTSDDSELTAGQMKKNAKQTLKAQLLIMPTCPGEQQVTALVQPCGGWLSIRGAVHTRAYLHGNKPKAKLVEKLLKRDVVSTVAVRSHMILEELMTSEENKEKDWFSLPRRVWCPVKGAGPVCVCDYQFSDEGLSEVTDRLKEILDVDALQEDLDITQEVSAVTMETSYSEAETLQRTVDAPSDQKKNYVGVAMVTAVALLATAASLLYFDDN